MAQLVDGRSHLRQDRRITERIARHQRTNLHTPCSFGKRRQHCPAFPNSPGWLARVAIQEVVREPDTIEAIRFRLLRDRADRIIWTPAVVFPGVRQENHQTDLHG